MTQDLIEIDALRLRCEIGFSAHEIGVKQDVVISLKIAAEMRQAGATDQPEDALNYRTITKAIIAHVEASRYRLVEALADSIARLCVVDHGVTWVQVRVHKPGALRFADSVGVLIERTPADYPLEAAPTVETIAYLSLGSNIAPQQHLTQAVSLLREHCDVLALSAVYQSPAFGFADQPDFLDIVAKVHTTHTPLQFKTQVLDAIERACGRDRANQINPNGPLPLDIDILLWGDSALTFGEKPWRVPNKGITKFAAVAIPLAALAPDTLHPTEGVTLAEIAARFPATDRAQVLRLNWQP